MFWACFGNVLLMFVGCFWDVFGMLLFGMFAGCFGDVLGCFIDDILSARAAKFNPVPCGYFTLWIFSTSTVWVSDAGILWIPMDFVSLAVASAQRRDPGMGNRACGSEACGCARPR